MPENGNKEVLEAIHTLANQMDERFAESRNELRTEIAKVRSEVGSVRDEVRDVRNEVSEGFNSVEHLFREEDKKIDRLTEKLLLKRVISEKEMKEVMDLGPFPAGT